MTDFAQGDPGEYAYDQPQRTSVLAILSLVLSLICFLPLLGVLGILFGVFALVGIGSSGGRVKGTGLAIAGIVIGLIVSVLWTGAGFAINSGLQQFPKFAAVMTEVENGSLDTARSYMTPSSRALATDEAFEAFRAAYQAELGSFQSAPSGAIELFEAYAEIGPAMQTINQGTPYQGQLIPIPGRFDNGNGLVILVFDAAAQQTGPTQGPLNRNLGVMTTSGTTFWLIEPTVEMGQLGGGSGEGGTDESSEVPPAGEGEVEGDGPGMGEPSGDEMGEG